ncbi:MAG: alpha-N-acetylglucosaminidase N-terminal domain-containing protein, partial [Bacteroidaceae bacterium]|nr:alpha-N-acetylglucosaminidase N-terminal domain-containing protein [Bacteroidaceae bacterium]
MKHKFLTVLLAVTSSLNAWAATSTDPQPVVDLVNRVCGSGASANFTFTLDTDFNGGVEAFQLGGSANAVTVKANTLSALTTGLNWYLNHDAHVNISWNNLRETPSSYPAPADQSVHAAKGKYRYYLNYCTFSYSMSFWNEDRWMKEIDWMALHGVNLPLQIVGMDAVWYYMLREQFGFTHAEATAFVAGPAFQGWWLMNNITGHGGNNPEWWYKRQAELGRKITDRMRELGMEPCLPGYVGMAPQKYVSDTGATSYSGSWNAMASPLLIDPGTAYTNMATQYYAYINKVYDFMPTAFSIDPCHERNIPSGYNYTNA